MSSFERAALPHLDAAYALAYWLVRSRPDAEDVVQDAYLRAFKSFGALRGDDIRPWLLTIVRNVAYRSIAKRSRGANVVSFDEAIPGRGGYGHASGQGGTSRRTFEASVAADVASAEAVLISEDERVMVAGALAQLPAPFREVVVLREFDGMAYRDIADVTGVPIGTVMSRLARARAALKKILTAQIEKDDSNAM